VGRPDRWIAYGRVEEAWVGQRVGRGISLGIWSPKTSPVVWPSPLAARQACEYAPTVKSQADQAAAQVFPFVRQALIGTRDLWADSRLTPFAFPPATEAQLIATERELGYPLPGMLRALYSQLANGGFGPVYGLAGIATGYLMERDLDNRPLEFPPRFLRI
jgi:hypothetical protein